MRPPETVYRGERLTGPGMTAVGVRVTVTEPGGRPRALYPNRSQRLFNHSPDGFEWGYQGSGPAQLALALVLDVTDDAALSRQCHQWFKVAAVSCWGERWDVTAGEVLRLVDQWRRESAMREAAAASPAAAAEGGAT